MLGVHSFAVFGESGLARGFNQDRAMVTLAAADRDWFAGMTGENDGKPVVFCLPFAGGGAAAWAAWTRRPIGGVAFAGVRLPGRESLVHLAPLTSIDEMAENVVDRLFVARARPYSLFGHGMGALVAYEVARRVRERGWAAPAALAVSGCRAPWLPDRHEPLHRLPDGEFVAAIERRFGAIPLEMRRPDVLDLLVPALRADMLAVESYCFRPAEPLAVPILALGGSGDPLVSQAEVRAWRRMTAAGCDVAFFAGRHFFVEHSAAAVGRCVARFVAAHASAEFSVAA